MYCERRCLKNEYVNAFQSIFVVDDPPNATVSYCNRYFGIHNGYPNVDICPSIFLLHGVEGTGQHFT